MLVSPSKLLLPKRALAGLLSSHRLTFNALPLQLAYFV
jgi:hypothetical protein